jgi:hypothetical protein
MKESQTASGCGPEIFNIPSIFEPVSARKVLNAVLVVTNCCNNT